MHVCVSALLPILLFIPSADPRVCVRPPSSATKPPKKDAETARRAGRHLDAAAHWQRAADLYPVCTPAHAQRVELVLRALKALQRAHGTSMPACSDLDLQAAVLIRRILTELHILAERGDSQPEVQAEFAGRLAALPEAARGTAAFLDEQTPPLPLPAAIAAHAESVAAFGSCPAPRVALVRHVLAGLAPDAPGPLACDPTTQAARQALHDAMAALEKAEPATAKTTPEYLALQQRLAALDDEGPALTTLRTQAMTATDLDEAAGRWATRARTLPTCAPYLTAKHDATLAALTAWNRPGAHRETPQRRYMLADRLLHDTLSAIETDHGGAARKWPEHISLTEARAALVPPPAPKQPRPSVKPATGNPRSTAPEPHDRRVHSLRTGLAISGALTGAALGVATGLTLAARREGPLYDDIVDASLAAGINPYTKQDLCAAEVHGARGQVPEECAQHATVRGAAIGMWSLSAAAAISTVVFSVLYSKARKAPASRPTLSLTPSSTSWMLGAHLRF